MGRICLLPGRDEGLRRFDTGPLSCHFSSSLASLKPGSIQDDISFAGHPTNLLIPAASISFLSQLFYVSELILPDWGCTSKYSFSLPETLILKSMQRGVALKGVTPAHSDSRPFELKSSFTQILRK